tara:strand:+ start:233 stop:508 length:276 start_codon:yes stop_codon:yes gene_type:complete
MKNDLRSLDSLDLKVNDFCEYCRKICYDTQQDAKNVAARVCKQGHGHSYSYQCPKGKGWHLTSQKRNKSAKTPKVRKSSKSFQSKKNKKLS